MLATWSEGLHFILLLLSFCVSVSSASYNIREIKFICGRLWTEKFKLWAEFYDCFSWLFKISFSFLLQVNMSGVAMNHPAQEPLGPLQSSSFEASGFVALDQSVSQSAAVVKSCNLVSSQIFGGRGHSTCQKQNQTMSKLSWFITPAGRSIPGKFKNIGSWAKNLCVSA